MERLKIKEAIERHEQSTKKDFNWDRFLKKVFPDTEVGIGRDAPLSRDRKRILITYWDRGEQLTRCHPRHIKRIADFFGIKLLRDIVQYDYK